MRERERAGLTAAGLCLVWALLRAFAPSMPFDWMSLVLVLAAAAALLLPYCIKDAKPVAVRRVEPASEEPAELETAALPDDLKARLSDWPMAQGDMADALYGLYAKNPFGALCAARGMLALLQTRIAAEGEDAQTLAALADALDDITAQGENRADGAAVEAAFEAALRALGHLA